MRCLQCNYDLGGLTVHRCPECGREFDPKNPNSVFDDVPVIDDIIRSSRKAVFIAFYAPFCAIVLIANLFSSDAFNDILSMLMLLVSPAAFMASAGILLGLLFQGGAVKQVAYPRIFRALACVILLWFIAIILFVGALQLV